MKNLLLPLLVAAALFASLPVCAQEGTADADTAAAQVRYLKTIEQLLKKQKVPTGPAADRDRQLLSLGRIVCRLKSRGNSDQQIVEKVSAGAVQAGFADRNAAAATKAALLAVAQTDYCASTTAPSPPAANSTP
ncbi:DUF732 domain-containing protein [Gloeobacter kilaueensis]|uniref:Uncharacterized protein n=1 Tax=Gloeobacter kilaueensis (strain ATCC BAA-2537 / CCAP 1431/1 / ULC 316 / JS1) TaxID=1183438 RepID=U5QIQ8_GLOK1|nr:DUF732 domain-containing protein [Gloeobacter kilaueensis]AGY58842.1 hypothetical protein GKIL_2596 [Gloeobacter kilaueensis JS1]